MKKLLCWLWGHRWDYWRFWSGLTEAQSKQFLGLNVRRVCGRCGRLQEMVWSGGPLWIEGQIAPFAQQRLGELFPRMPDIGRDHKAMMAELR